MRDLIEKKRENKMMGAIRSGRDVGIQFVKILSPITNSDKRFELIQGRI